VKEMSKSSAVVIYADTNVLQFILLLLCKVRVEISRHYHAFEPPMTGCAKEQ